MRTVPLAAFVLAVAAAATGAERSPLRVLLVSDGPSAGISLLRPQLARMPALAVRVTEEPASLSPAALHGYGAVLVDCGTLRVDSRLLKTLSAFVSHSGGIVYLRSSDCFARPGAPERPESRALSLEWTDARHPLAEALPRGFLTADRIGDAPAPPSGAQVLARANPGGAPLVWALPLGRGRILHTNLGADPAVMQESAFAHMVAGALEWASGRAVTTRAQPTEHGPAAGVRTLVVTGGHPYEASFYALFDDQDGIVTTIDPHPFPYRRGDLRKGYDVLVLYDSMQEANEVDRRNLTDFVASGKGIVILHHALVDYCDWNWWYEEVAGGRWYRTDDKPPRWITTWKHGVEQIVTPVGTHPVTRGVGVMHLWDETYKGMWFSPRNQVLMRSLDPSSDGPVVWIGRSKTSRVVNIELGHDHMAHRHPGYQRLVRNAILWSAGKLE
jgi:type 1 glutamine amidotransferase